MQDFNAEVRAFEDAFYSERTEVQIQAEALRNNGIIAVKRSLELGGDETLKRFGLDSLGVSVMVLAGTDRPDVPASEMPGRANRETYASVGMLARAYTALGDFDMAAGFAKTAVDITPAPYVISRTLRPIDFGEPDSSARLNAEADPYETFSRHVVLEDQYRAIFCGQLSLILAASSDSTGLEMAASLAKKARELAGISEDPNRVVFANRQMNEEERKATRSRFGRVAWMATGAIWTPLGIRRRIAQSVCAR